jgi:hypothetical protein
MGLILSPEDVHRAVDAVKSGRTIPDGPIIPAFEPCELASAIEQECHLVKGLDRPSLTLVLDPEDAVRMAQFLKSRPVLAGLFETRSLTESIENELGRTSRKQNRKVVITMHLEGALALAGILRFRTAG